MFCISLPLFMFKHKTEQWKAAEDELIYFMLKNKYL